MPEGPKGLIGIDHQSIESRGLDGLMVNVLPSGLDELMVNVLPMGHGSGPMGQWDRAEYVIDQHLLLFVPYLGLVTYLLGAAGFLHAPPDPPLRLPDVRHQC